MEYIQVGKISSIHGVKGELKAIPLTDDIRRFDDLDEVFVGMDKELMEIEKVSYIKNQVIIKFKDIDSVRDAEKLIGRFLWIDREDAIIDDDAYFLFEIIGLDVFDTEGNEIGRVKDVIQSGRNDLYLIRHGDSESLVPAVTEFVKEINIKEKRMVIDPIEGMLE